MFDPNQLTEYRLSGTPRNLRFRAGKILSISSSCNGNAMVRLALEGIAHPVERTGFWFVDQAPHVGGYYVVHEDARATYSDSEQFRLRYVPVQDENKNEQRD